MKSQLINPILLFKCNHFLKYSINTWTEHYRQTKENVCCMKQFTTGFTDFPFQLVFNTNIERREWGNSVF